MTAGTVTGRTYKKPRPRGFAPWAPRAEARALVADVLEVLDEYADYLPLTLRQVFYRLVGTRGYPKDEKAYARLLENMNRARRAELVPFDAIRDDGTVASWPGGYHGKPDFWQAIAYEASTYTRDRSAGQRYAIEVWVEAAGMVPQAERVAHPYGAAVFSSGGFDSVTAKHDAARRFVERDRDTVVLHVGDLDPSGCAIVDSAAEDVAAFCVGYDAPGTVEFVRVAVTPDQVERYGLPTAPQKRDDRRGSEMDATVQAEALPPDDLAAILRAALDALTDRGVRQAVLDAEAAERADLADQVALITRTT